jgi:hypothetical protein
MRPHLEFTRHCCRISPASGSGVLRGAVSGGSQPIEIASQVEQSLFDGSRRHRFGCPAGLSSFPAIITRRQRWRVFGLVHEPQRSSANHGRASPARYPARAARSVFGFGCDPPDGLLLVPRIVAGNDCARALTGTLTSRSLWSGREFSSTWRCGMID